MGAQKPNGEHSVIEEGWTEDRGGAWHAVEDWWQVHPDVQTPMDLYDYSHDFLVMIQPYLKPKEKEQFYPALMRARGRPVVKYADVPATKCFGCSARKMGRRASIQPSGWHYLELWSRTRSAVDTRQRARPLRLK